MRYLENVAYDPLIRNFPILAAFQGEKIFFSRFKVAQNDFTFQELLPK